MAEEQRSNKEGYSDPTADAAVARVDREKRREQRRDERKEVKKISEKLRRNA